MAQIRANFIIHFHTQHKDQHSSNIFGLMICSACFSLNKYHHIINAFESFIRNRNRVSHVWRVVFQMARM